jgi:hypothetical protein
LFNKEQGIVTVTYRRINGNITRMKNIPDDIVSGVN